MLHMVREVGGSGRENWKKEGVCTFCGRDVYDRQEFVRDLTGPGNVDHAACIPEGFDKKSTK